MSSSSSSVDSADLTSAVVGSRKRRQQQGPADKTQRPGKSAQPHWEHRFWCWHICSHVGWLSWLSWPWDSNKDITLRRGFPQLQQNLSRSPPSVPTEAVHAKCSRVVSEFPFLPVIPDTVLGAHSSIWNSICGNSEIQKLSYASEADICFYVRLFLMDIVKALNLDLKIKIKMKKKKM